jgi:hypothetical protein
MKGDKTMMNMNEVIAGVTLTKVCSIKADKDSTESKNITLKVKYDGVKLQSVFDKSLSGAVIAWQNGVGRKGYDTFKPNQIVEIQFSAPASRTAVDPETAMVAKLQSMTPEEQLTYLKELTAKASKKS